MKLPTLRGIYNNTNIKNKKIKSKKTYYVRVRAYATYKDKNNVTKKDVAIEILK